MSTAENQSSNAPEPDFDLEKHFVPAWAKKPSNENQYAHYAGEAGPRDDRRRGRGDRPPRPPGPPRPPDARRARPGPPDSRRPWDRENRPGRHEPPPREEKPLELLPVNITFVPDDSGVDSLARQIKMTGRAYPLFDIALMVLEKPERHAVTLSVRKNAEGTVLQPLFVCALDDTVWLAQDEAVNYVLDRHFTTFYQPERTQIDPPKGTYTFVAQCGMSGAILGPPNYHGYQEQLRKLHQERFARMPFEVFKARVKIVRDEAVVKKWVEDQSWRTEYVCLNLPEPVRLDSMEAVEKHFRETHKENIIKAVDSYVLNGAVARTLRSPDLARLARSVWEDQRRFPLQIATVLSQQFSGHGLQFFKVNKTLTHVCVARPHFLDMTATPVSEGVKRIVEYINAHPRSTRRQLVEALTPSPAAPAVQAVAGEPPPASPPEATQATPEQTAVVADLHWLIHQGHVIEFANGLLETAKKPLPKPEPKPVPAPAEPTAPAEPAAGSEAVVPEPNVDITPAPTAEEAPAPASAPTAEPPAATVESPS